MRRVAAILLLLTARAGAGNLLINPGFEEHEEDMPTGWHVYVEPQDGSAGMTDASCPLEGRSCVMLRNATAYRREPANNWSQNILQDLSGKTLVVSGSIKTDQATGAMFWLQCFRKKPWEVLLQRSSDDVKAMTGTHDWTPVEMPVTVPEGTDFVVLRCVLKGTGTAWFDQLSVEEENSLPPEPPVVEKPLRIPVAPTAPVMPKAPEIPGLEANPKGLASREDLLAAQDAIRQANEALRESNQAVADQLQAMREQLQALREQIRNTEVGESEADRKKEDAAIRPPVPPLVPHVPKPKGNDH